MRAAILLTLFLAGWAHAERMPYIPSDDQIKPCSRTVQIEPITRLVVHMTPFRGVNLIFPFRLNESTTYTLSSNHIWEFKAVKGTNSVPIYFKNFSKNDFGTINDFSISHEDINITIALVANPDLSEHCTNVVFELSEAMRKQLENEDKKTYLRAIKTEFDERKANLEQEIEKKALALVGTLSQRTPETTRINTEDAIRLANGDEIIVFVERIESFGRFNNIKFEIQNDSDSDVLYVNDVRVFRDDADGLSDELEGHAEFENRFNQRETKELVFTTLSSIPKTGASMVVDTNKGKVKVKW